MNFCLQSTRVDLDEAEMIRLGISFHVTICCFEVTTVVYQWAIHFYLISLNFFLARLFSTLFIVKFFVGYATYAVFTCFAQVMIEPSRTEDDSSDHLVVQNSAVIPLVSKFTLLPHIQFIIIRFLLTYILNLLKIS